MDRKGFLNFLTLLPVAGTAMNLLDFQSITEPTNSTGRMPVLFVGHGSPMNAIEDNEFTRGWKGIGSTLPKPRAILCISAHWETRGTQVTAMEKPKTIHDFGGFPQELFDLQYPAPGSPGVARETKSVVSKTEVSLDEQWGLDHGAWSVIRNLYPKADIPVVQMSLDYMQGPQYHYDLAKELASLRDKGILIIGSGNMVHNLRLVAWDRMKEPNFGFDWALEANAKMKELISQGDHLSLIGYPSLGNAIRLAVPSPDHFLPLLYTLALKGKNDEVSFFNDKAVMGSLTMTSLKIG
jgi:4,5-DOPA dioxygenase extradiol